MNGHFRKMTFVQILNIGQRLVTRMVEKGLGKIQKREVGSSALRELSFDDDDMASCFQSISSADPGQ